MSKKEEFDQELSELRTLEDIKGGMIVSRDGLSLASQFPENVYITGSKTAAIIGTAKSSLEKMEAGELKKVIIEGEEGKYVLIGAGKRLVLGCLLGKNPDLEAVLNKMKDTADSIKGMI